MSTPHDRSAGADFPAGQSVDWLEQSYGPVRFVTLHDGTVARDRACRLVRRLTESLADPAAVHHGSWDFDSLGEAGTNFEAGAWVCSSAVIVVATGSKTPEDLRSNLEGWLPNSPKSPIALVLLHPGAPAALPTPTLASSLESVATRRGIRFFSRNIPRVTLESSPARNH